MDFSCRRKLGTIRYCHIRTEVPDPGAERFERHCHPHYEALYIVQGRGKFVVEGMEYPLREGMLMLLRPHEYHFMQPDPSFPYERIYINFSSADPIVDPDEMASLQAGYGAGQCYLPEAMAAGVGQQLLGLDICSEMKEQDAAALFRAGLTQLLLTLSVSSPLNEQTENALTAGVMAYLTEHLAEELRLEELAKKLYVSKYHLCRVFRSHAGVTVLEYLTAKRVAKAQALLQQGVSAADAAQRTGFSEYSTFYRAYRRITGKAPTRQRKTGKTPMSNIDNFCNSDRING